MIKEEYSDLIAGEKYEIEHLYADGHVRLKTSQRVYMRNSFHIFRNGKKISFREAYRIQQLEEVRRKIGLKG